MADSNTPSGRAVLRIALETENEGKIIKLVHTTSQRSVTVQRFPSQDDQALVEHIKPLLPSFGDGENTDIYITSKSNPDVKQRLEEQLNLRPKVSNPLSCAVKGLHFLLNSANQLTEINHVTSESANQSSTQDGVIGVSTNEKQECQKVSTNQQQESHNVSLGPACEFTETKYFSLEELEAEIASKEAFLKTSVPHIRKGSSWEISDSPLADYKRFVLDTWDNQSHDTDIYPALLLTLDDNVTCVKVNSPGQPFEVMDINSRGLAALTGLGSLLTGAKNLQELLTMAEKGDYRNIHVTVQPPPSMKNPYDHLMNSSKADKPQPSVMFCFGLAEGKSLDDFSKEDLAMALLWQELLDIITHVLPLVMPGSGFRHVIAVGSLLERPLVAKWFIKLWQSFSLNVAMFGGKRIEVPLHLLKHGSYLHTLGAVL